MIALQVLPWADMIEKAPKIAEGATKLWDVVSRSKARINAKPKDGVAPARLPEEQAAAALELKLSANDAAIEMLHDQMVAAVRVTADVAMQNEQLIKRMDVLNRYLLRASIALGLVSVMAVSALILALVR